MSVSPTRMNLLILKRRLTLAQRGHDLLQEKLDALLMNFFKYSHEYREHREKTIEELRRIYRGFLKAIAVSGEASIETVSSASSPIASVEVVEQNVMGVRLPKISLKLMEKVPSYPITESNAVLEDAVKELREAMESLVRLAELEGGVLRLYAAILSTRRRVNALKYIIIPNVNTSVATIEQMLSERSREDFFRLKRIKSKLAEKAAGLSS